MSGEGGTGPDDDLTRLTVNLTDKSAAALDDTASRTGLSRTDIVNRAIQLYGSVAVVAQHEGDYQVTAKDFDERGALYLVVSRRAHKRRWLPW